ncbi:VCBS repeat-containing protein, partial [Myxococcota bacterium]|nr:VCBS repeat-containing protein [Myxococcota bacterium]
SGTFAFFRNVGTLRAPAFVAQAGPLAGFDVGESSAPTFGDLDADGDVDLLAGERSGSFRYFENTGTRVAPSFVERVGPQNPMSGFTLEPGSSLPSPALGDIDEDGDLDVVAGFNPGTFRVYRNRGTARRPVFEELVQASNPLRGESVGSSFSRPAFGDLEADGDLDVVAGADLGGFAVLENLLGYIVPSNEIDPNPIGFASSSVAAAGDLDGDGDVEIAGAGCAFAINTGSRTSPAFAPPGPLPGLTGCDAPFTVDLDRDGDLDAVAEGKLYVNSGSATSPSFGPPTTLFPQTTLLRDLTFDFPILRATFADVDRDGDFDAAVPYGFGNIFSTHYYENVGSPTSPSFVRRTGVANPLPSAQDPIDPTPWALALVDFDGDRDGDLLISSNSTTYWENIGISGAFFSPVPEGPKHPFAKLFVSPGQLGQRSAPIAPAADLDGDGDGDSFGIVRVLPATPPTFSGFFYENAGVRPSPRSFGPIASPFTNQDIGLLSSPAAGDLDGDGDPDFVAGSYPGGAIRYFENVGSAVLPSVVERVGAANPFLGLVSGTRPVLTLVDLNGDGDLELVSSNDGLSRFFRNTGTTTVPAFVEQVGAANPLSGAIAPRGAPSFGDLDRDGDLDLVVGRYEGTFSFFRNTGTATTPLFAEQLGAANPLDGFTVGFRYATASLGDVDRDGDLDLVSGDEMLGRFNYFENTGSATAPAFAARSGLENPYDGQSVGLNSKPVLVDLDADGDLDLVSGNRDGDFDSFYLPEPSLIAQLLAGLGALGRLARGRRRAAKPRSPGRGSVVCEPFDEARTGCDRGDRAGRFSG